MKTTTLQARIARLMPAGEPRYVRCYESPDDGSFDRYTVCYTGRAATLRCPGYAPEYQYVGLSGHGFTNWQHCDTMKTGNGGGYVWPPAMGRTGRIGKRIPFSALPDGLKATVLSDYREIWSLNAETK